MHQLPLKKMQLKTILVSKTRHCLSGIIIDEGVFYSGRKVAIDASMCLYQFLIAVRQEGHVLTNDTGEDTR